MQLSTKLDCDLVAVEHADELTLLVELTAPTPATTATRQAATLQVVLDRSGSMAGDRLEGAKKALIALVDRLDPTDNLGVVAFDDAVQVVVPAGPLTDKAAVKRAIAAIDAGGSTDLSVGLPARTAGGPPRRRSGRRHRADRQRRPRQRRRRRPGTARARSRSRPRPTASPPPRSASGSDTTRCCCPRSPAAVRATSCSPRRPTPPSPSSAARSTACLTQVAQAASLRVTWTPHVAGIQVLNDLPVVGLDRRRHARARLVLRRRDPPAADQAADPGDRRARPDAGRDAGVHARLAAGPRAAHDGRSGARQRRPRRPGRRSHPATRRCAARRCSSETQKAKRESSRLLMYDGDITGATRLLRQTSRKLSADSATLPAEFRGELDAEARVVAALADEAGFSSERASKAMSMSATVGSRYRGRKTLRRAGPSRCGGTGSSCRSRSGSCSSCSGTCPPPCAPSSVRRRRRVTSRQRGTSLTSWASATRPTPSSPTPSAASPWSARDPRPLLLLDVDGVAQRAGRPTRVRGRLAAVARGDAKADGDALAHHLGARTVIERLRDWHDRGTSSCSG